MHKRALKEEKFMQRWVPDHLKMPSGRIDMVLDTDTYNEIDDQFALCYALLSPEKVNVQAIYAAPFYNSLSMGPADGMEKSYREILRLLKFLGREPEGLAFRGSDRYFQTMQDTVLSPAALDLVSKAMSRPEGSDPLFVVAIGAITNVVSALHIEPKIAEKIHIVWLGGRPLHDITANEFNLSGDMNASRELFEIDVPLTVIPCAGVASHLTTTIPELERWIGGKNELCDALIKLMYEVGVNRPGASRVIWDISAVARVLHPEWVHVLCESKPILSAEGNWSRDAGRKPFLVCDSLNRDAIFADLFEKLGSFHSA